MRQRPTASAQCVLSRPPHALIQVHRGGDPRPERRRVIHTWIDRKRVDRAESFLEEKFRGEVFIPDELWDALNAPAVAA